MREKRFVSQSGVWQNSTVVRHGMLQPLFLYPYCDVRQSLRVNAFEELQNWGDRPNVQLLSLRAPEQP